MWRSYQPSPPGCRRPRGRRPSCSSESRRGCTKKCTAPKRRRVSVRSCLALFHPSAVTLFHPGSKTTKTFSMACHSVHVRPLCCSIHRSHDLLHFVSCRSKPETELASNLSLVTKVRHYRKCELLISPNEKKTTFFLRLKYVKRV